MVDDRHLRSSIGHLLTATLISLAHASPVVIDGQPSHEPTVRKFEFASIGDSFASGVTYGINGYTNYDSNDPPCMRVNHAYSVQLEKDWPVDPLHNLEETQAHLTFAACSGSRLVDMVQGQHQLDHTSEDTKLVLMQAGGNDAGFLAVATDCIFHQAQNQNFGAEYPAQGDCSSTIARVQGFIDAPITQAGTLKYTSDTIRDVLNDKRAKNTNFKLYVIGYPHFFNIDDNWCNEASFSVNTVELALNRRPKLSSALRKKINDLTERLNNQMRAAIAAVGSPKVVFVDTTRGFDGHRFCEDKHSISDQYFSDDVYFWNASPAGFFNLASVFGGVEQSVVNTKYSDDYIFDKDPKNAANYGWNWSDLFREDKNIHALSPNQDGSPGLVLRTFHPKEAGHRVMKDAIKQQVINDFPFNS